MPFASPLVKTSAACAGPPREQDTNFPPGNAAAAAPRSFGVPLGGIAGKQGLNHIPELPIDDRRVFARIRYFLVNGRSPASGSRTRLHAFTHDGPRPSRVRRTSRKCP